MRFTENTNGTYDMTGLTTDEVLAIRSRLSFDPIELLDASKYSEDECHHNRALAYEQDSGNNAVIGLRRAIPRLEIPSAKKQPITVALVKVEADANKVVLQCGDTYFSFTPDEFDRIIDYVRS